MAGELDFEQALRARVRAARWLPESGAGARLRGADRGSTPARGRWSARWRRIGPHTMLVSGGFTFFSERVARGGGLCRAPGEPARVRRTGASPARSREPVLGRAAKLGGAGRGAGARGLAPAEALAVGDGANDIDMVEAAGLGVGFRPKAALASRADAVIVHAGLEGLLALQGIGADEQLT